MKALEIIVFGKVQGVFFRDHTRDKAIEFDVVGWVQNKSDGSVRIHAEGKDTDLKEFLAWCYRGSPMSSVGKVEFHESEVLGYDEFKIRI